jgi:hypothetical protein
MNRTRALFPVLCLLAACSEREITVKLEPEGGCESACGQQDISCLEQLKLEVFGDEGNEGGTSSCVEVAAGPRSVCNAGLGGAIELKIPSGVERAAIDGIGPGAASGCAGPPLFVGGAFFSTDQDTVPLTVHCTLSCETIATQTLTLIIDDFMGEGPPEDVTALAVEVGLLIDADALRYGIDDGGTAPTFHPFSLEMQAPPTIDGWVTLVGTAFEDVVGPNSCAGVAIEHAGGGDNGLSMGCFSVESEETRVSWLAPAHRQRLEGLLRDAGVVSGQGYLVIRVRSEDEQPLAGVRAESLPPDTGVIYGIDDELLSREALASATTESGLLVIYGPTVGEIMLEPPPGLQEASLMVGIVEERVGAREVVLPPSE